MWVSTRSRPGSLASWRSSSGHVASPPPRVSPSCDWQLTRPGVLLEVRHLHRDLSVTVNILMPETYQELLAEENVLGRVGVVGGLASLGLLAGRGAGRLVLALAGAGVGAGIC